MESASSAEIANLCNSTYPFLQIINSEAVFAEETPVKFITTSTGWVIHDYGDAISISAPHNLKKSAKIANAVNEVVSLIAGKGWTKAELIGGVERTKRPLWIGLQRYGIELTGYEPSGDDKKCLERWMKIVKNNGEVWEKPVPGKQQNGLAVAGAS